MAKLFDGLRIAARANVQPAHQSRDGVNAGSTRARLHATKTALLCLIIAALLLSPQPASADFLQQGPKLVGARGAVGAQQGWSVALSADGNTAIVGGPLDAIDVGATHVGAAWIFTRANGVWTQQGPKLVGTGAVRLSLQGSSVALSGDGNTAVVGGRWDSNSVGATWVFTRSNGVWTQQGNKLVGTGAVGQSNQGASVALSADGNTAVVGGPWDNNSVGAPLVQTSSNGVRNAIVGVAAYKNAVGAGYGAVGATWVFTRSKLQHVRPRGEGEALACEHDWHVLEGDGAGPRVDPPHKSGHP